MDFTSKPIGELRVDSLPEFVARALCPELVTVPVRGKEISEMSSRVMDIFRQYDPKMIVAGCDEGYLK